MYLVDDVHRVILPRTFKAASTSLQAALGSCTYAIGKEKAQNLLSYTWIIVARHPFSRLASAWGMKDRTKIFDLYDTFPDLVDDILRGGNTDPQTFDAYLWSLSTGASQAITIVVEHIFISGGYNACMDN